MTSPDDLLRFIGSSFRCVWALELLFVLKKEPLAFALLGTGQAILALANIPTEERSSIYLIRLATFSLILVAIYRKNRGARN